MYTYKQEKIGKEKDHRDNLKSQRCENTEEQV